MPDLREARLRHTEHYATVLRAANELYQQGGNALKQGLAFFDLNWENIKTGQRNAEKKLENFCALIPGASVCSRVESYCI